MVEECLWHSEFSLLDRFWRLLAEETHIEYESYIQLSAFERCMSNMLCYPHE